MKKIVVIILFCTAHFSFAQREANLWYFGDEGGIDFNSCEPVTSYNRIKSTEGCTVIANGLGELQFYTEGTTIWDKNHDVMYNGRDLGGHRSATQSSMIVKRPGASNEYYVFTIDERGKSNGLMYSTVDMTGASGLGVVTTKNTPLIAPVVEKIHAVRHANGEDVWVSVHGFENANFYSFLVTAAGVNTNPVISNVGPVISGTELATIGAMKFSPNQKKLAIANYEHGVGLYDFDNNSGLFSNPVEVTNRLYSYGIEFSKSNNLLYLSTSYLDLDNKLLQYDLQAAIIQDSETLLFDLADAGGIGSIQIAPDSKVYVSIIGRDYLSVINEPDRLGAACEFVEDGFYLDGGTAKGGLPLFLSPIFYDEMIVEETCLGDITNFRLSKNVNAITWDFGDPDSGADNSSTEIEPLHIFSAPGTYTITTNIPANCGPYPTITKVIEVSDIEVASSVQLVQCADDSDGFSFFNLNEAAIKISPEGDQFLFYKTADDAKSRENPISSASSYENVIANSDSVWASVENDSGCFELIEILLIVSENTIFESVPHLVLDNCDDAKNDGVTFFDLSVAETSIKELFPDQDIEISYFRNLQDAYTESEFISEINSYENIGYPYAQDIYVRIDEIATNDCLGIGNPISLIVRERPQFELATEAKFCLIDTPSLTLEAYNPEDTYSYEWTDSNGNSISTSIDATVNEGGVYTLVATASNGCTSFPKQINVTAFKKIERTPNLIKIDDGINNNTISIDETELGPGTYEYALDNEFGDFQELPFFQNVSAGIHTLYAREINNCKPSAFEISIIGFPKFFTPNNDSLNDTWNLEGLGNAYASNSKVSIYDRFGNFLKQISTDSPGWDGTCNGKNVVSSDYWFQAELINEDGNTRVLRGHFSLLR
jgi:gliding motility-associated-like protein